MEQLSFLPDPPRAPQTPAGSWQWLWHDGTMWHARWGAPADAFLPGSFWGGYQCFATRDAAVAWLADPIGA